MEKKISPIKNTLYEFMKDVRTKNASITAQMFRAGGPTLQSINFQELYEKIQLISFGFIKLGIQKGDRIGLVADSGPKFMWLARVFSIFFSSISSSIKISSSRVSSASRRAYTKCSVPMNGD